MSGQKQSFRFRLPWLPSLVSAPVRPSHSRHSSSQRPRKTKTPSPSSSPPPTDSVSVIYIGQPEGESPDQFIQPVAEAPLETISRTLFSKTDSQPPGEMLSETKPQTESQPEQVESIHLRHGKGSESSAKRAEMNKVQPMDNPTELNQQPLTQAGMVHSETDSQSSSEEIDEAAQEEQNVSQIHVSGTDSIPQHVSSTNSASVQSSPKQDTLYQESELQPLTENDSPLPPGSLPQPPSPTRESKALTHSKYQSPSPPKKPSPTRAKSQPRPPSHVTTPTRANSKPSSPSNAGNHVHSPAKQPSRAAAHLRTTSLPPSPSPSRGVKSTKVSSKSPSTSPSTRSHRVTAQPPSPPLSPSSQSSSTSYSTGESSESYSTNESSESYSTNESSDVSNQQPTPNPTNSQHKQNSKAKTFATESHTPVVVYDTKEPVPSQGLKIKEAIATGFTNHRGTEQPTDTEDTEQDKSQHWSARNKGKRKLFTKKVLPSSQGSNENRHMGHHSNKGDVQRNIQLHKEIKNDVSNLIQQLSLGKLSHPKSGDPVSVITISGNNKGATFHIGNTLPGNEVKVKLTGDGEGYYSDRTKNNAYVNSNIQSINNSMLLSSSVHERNPGVHFGTFGNDALLAEANKKEESSEASRDNQVQVNLTTTTTAGKLANQPMPIIRRRCLRGLFMESSESEPDNPDKPRRHGCRAACGDKQKYDF